MQPSTVLYSYEVLCTASSLACLAVREPTGDKLSWLVRLYNLVPWRLPSSEGGEAGEGEGESEDDGRRTNSDSLDTASRSSTATFLPRLSNP